MRIILLFLLLLELGVAKKIALVIGNSNYAKGYLANPINDAELIRDILRDDLNFKVTYKTDLTKPQMEKLIQSFATSIKSNDIALFYYAGHGMQYKYLNYLIPLKANAVTEGQIPSVGVDVNYVLGGMEKAKLAVVLLDACRNNPFSRSFRRGGTRGLAQVSSNQRNYIISYATEAGAETQDGSGVNSPYALALKEYLPKSLEISRLLKMVKNRVAESTNPQQIPYVDDRYVGEYKLSSGDGGSCTKVVRVPAAYKSVKEKVLVGGNGVKKVAVPAKYGWASERIKVADGYTFYTWIENGVEKSMKPKFQTVTKRLLVSDGTEKYIINDNKAKKVTTPPIYKKIYVQKVIEDVDISTIPSSANYKSIVVPAKGTVVKIKRMISGASVKEVDTPTYKTISKKVLLTPETTKTISIPCKEIK